MFKTIIYLGGATTDSISRQKEICMAYANENRIETPLVLRERISGIADNKPMLDVLCTMATAGVVDTVLIFSVDRISRNHGQVIAFLEKMEECGVRVRSVIDAIDGAELLCLYKDLFSAHYSEIHSKRTKAGIVRAKEKKAACRK